MKKNIQLSGHNAAVFALCPGQSPRHFLSGAGDGWLVEWDLANPDPGKLLARVETQIFSLLYLPDQDTAVAGNMNGGIHWVDLRNPANNRNIAHHQKGVFALRQAGDWVFSAGGEGSITRWDPLRMHTVESLQLSNQSLRCIDYSPHRHELAVGGSENTIWLLDASTLEIRQRLPQAHSNSVFCLRYHPDGRHILSGSRDAHLKVWNLSEAPIAVHDHPAHWYTLNDIAFHPEGHTFATASRDKTIRLWDAATFQPIATLDTIRNGCHVNSVNALLWSPWQNSLVSCSDDRTLIIWS